MKEHSAHKGEYASLLEDKTIRRWYDNVARGSVVTADVYLRRLGHFCHDLKLTPQKLLEMSESQLYDLFLDTVSKLELEGRSGSYIHSILKAVKSWLLHNRIEVKGRIKIKGLQDTPTLKDERVPTKDELKRIFLAGDEKARVASVMVAQSGLRIEALGNYLGNDGLRVSDLPELAVKDGVVEFAQVPAIVLVRRELSKARHQYFSFLSEEGCGYLKDYLELRIREGEDIMVDSAIVTPKQRMKPFIRATNIGDAIRESVRKAGFSWRPYVLRSYFDTQLMLAESKGLVLRDYRQFWMGHVGDMENRYTTNKCKLPEAVIEDMREAYRRSQEFLQTKKKGETSEEELRDSFRKQILLVAGFNQEEVDKMDLPSMSDEELQSLVRKKLLGVSTSNNSKQKVVSLDEANGFLEKGWEFVAKLSDSKVVIKMNSTSP
jgi:site-specific recombinase XerD